MQRSTEQDPYDARREVAESPAISLPSSKPALTATRRHSTGSCRLASQTGCARQIALGNDIHSDGEFWKARDAQYYNSRVTGVEMRPLNPGEGPSILVHQQERHMPDIQRVF